MIQTKYDFRSDLGKEVEDTQTILPYYKHFGYKLTVPSLDWNKQGIDLIIEDQDTCNFIDFKFREPENWKYKDCLIEVWSSWTYKKPGWYYHDYVHHVAYVYKYPTINGKQSPYWAVITADISKMKEMFPQFSEKPPSVNKLRRFHYLTYQRDNATPIDYTETNNKQRSISLCIPIKKMKELGLLVKNPNGNYFGQFDPQTQEVIH